MDILIINKYLYLRGGDSQNALCMGKKLEDKGHKIFFWGMKNFHNPEYFYGNSFVENIDYSSNLSFTKKVHSSANLLYSLEAKNKIRKIVRFKRPDVVHLHNIYHQISPSVLHVFKKYKIPVVMTLHDYKLVCASYSMLADGKPCEACRNGRYYNCFLKKCVKNSRSKSLLNTIEMYLHHKIMHIYDLVDVFISPSLFLKNKLEEMGFKGKIVHIPNFVNLDEYEPKYDWDERSIVYFGRLSKEKGLSTLINAMKGLNLTLKIIGEGPERQKLEDQARSLGILQTPNSELKTPGVAFLGYMSGDVLKDEIRKSMFVVLPSECYENNPLMLIEAFALGKPVIGADVGGISELVNDNDTGLMFAPGKVDELRLCIEKLLADSGIIGQMGYKGRKFVEKRLTADKYYEELMKIYKQVLK